MIGRWLGMGALLGVIGLATYSLHLSNRNAALRASLERAEASLKTCSARLVNILEDVESDNEVDNWGDLRRVPDGWLFDPAGSDLPERP